MNKMNMNHNIDPNTLPDIKCHECGSAYWKQVVKVKYISRLISPDGQDNLATVPVIICSKCNMELEFAIEKMNEEKSTLITK